MSSPIPPALVSSSWGRRLARWRVEALPSGVPQVRTSLRRTLQRWGVAPERAETLLLAATELLSNAVRHAGRGAAARVCLTVALRGGHVCLDVADGDPFLPCVGPDVGVEAEGGRGLLIVDCLVGEVGGWLAVFRVPSGKVVGVRIPDIAG